MNGRLGSLVWQYPGRIGHHRSDYCWLFRASPNVNPDCGGGSDMSCRCDLRANTIRKTRKANGT